MQVLTDFFIGWLKYDFVKIGLVGVVLFAPMYGMLGTMVVSGKLAFFSDSLGHSALTGVAIGAMLGLSSQIPSTVAFGVVFAIGLTVVKSRGKASTDTTLGVFSSAALALGLVLMSLGGGFAKYSSILVGDLLAMQSTDLIPLAAALVCTAVYMTFRYNKLLLAVSQPAIAKSRGINPMRIEVEFACVLAAVVMLSIRWVGVLMLNAMLIIPAACSRNISASVRKYVTVSIVFATASGIFGLLLSFALGTASGATIVLVLAVIYVYTLTYVK
ncbi:MAG: metal ABC transporter permease [Oscillospiraceae bacterium]|jgi:zinc transport system permease protein|nr:metal ABC transporter permease [Oscillospiraceae bacterium]